MKKLLALVLAIVMILSLSITASALELDEYIYMRIDLEGVMEETTAVLNFGEEVGGLHLSKDNNGYYFNVYYDEKLAGAFTIIVEYYDENGEAVRIESDPMYLADIDGIIVLDENGFHVENTYVFQTADDGRNSKTIPVTGTYAGGEEPETVISVDIEWGSMDFVYVPVMEWNPVTHTYESAEDSSGTWELAEGKNNHVRVTNHSNADIDVSFRFNGSEVLGITGVFTSDFEGQGDVVTGFQLLSADLDFAAGDYERADNNAVFLQLTGGEMPVDETEKVVIGEVFVTINVSDEQTE